jgi:hypothetical protein
LPPFHPIEINTATADKVYSGLSPRPQDGR